MDIVMRQNNQTSKNHISKIWLQSTTEFQQAMDMVPLKIIMIS